MKIAILGLGRVGTTLLSSLISSDLPIETIYLHDKDKNLVRGQAEDLRDMCFLCGKEIKIEENISEAKDSDIYIITAGIPRKNSNDDYDFEGNMGIVMSCLSYCNYDKPIWIATNPAERIVKSLKDIFVFKELEAIGSLLDTARKVRTNKDPEEIAGYILDNKGYTNLGVVGEILLRLRSMVKTKYHDGGD